MSPTVVGAVGLFVVVYGLVAWRAFRNPLLGRLALREAIRRRGQSLLVIGGLLIGAAAITASLVGADSARDSSVLNAYRSWGMVDLTVASKERFFPADDARTIASDPALRGLLDGVQPAIQLNGSVGDLTQRQGQAGVTVLGFDPAAQASFGRFGLTDGRTTTGQDLGFQQALISHNLADELGARVGDRLQVQVDLPGSEKGLTLPAFQVAGIAKGDGPGAYTLSPTVFTTLSTLQLGLGTDGINLVRISADGGLVSGVQGGERAVGPLRRAVQGIVSPVPLEVKQAKRDDIEGAKQNTKFVLALLIGMSMLIVAAGAALVVNLTMMLAEERRPRLAVLRALGLTRRGLVSLSVIEGAIYSVAAAAAGTAIGVFAGKIVAARFADAFAQFFGASVDLRFVLALHPATLAVSFATGAMITLATVFFAARRTSRMSIPSAIRNLPEPAHAPSRRRIVVRRVLLVVGGLLGLVMLAAPGQPSARLIGGVAVILVAAALLRKRLADRWHATITGAVLALWAFFMVNATSNESDPNKFFALFTLSVLAAVFGLSIAAAANLRLVERGVGALGRLARGLRPTLRPPLAYLARRPLRTGITTGVFAVILAIVSMLAVFLSIFRPQYERDSGGYEVRVLSTGSPHVTLPASVQPLVAKQAPIPTIGYVGPIHTPGFSSGTIFLPMFEFSSALLRDPPVHLQQRDKLFGNDAAVWRAVTRDPHWVVSNFGNPGDLITLVGDHGPTKVRIAATQVGGVLSGVIGSERALAPFSLFPVGEVLLVHVTPGADPQHVARLIERDLFAQGVDASTTRELLDKAYRANRTFFSVVQVLMQMGLVVGILSLGIVAFRAVVERRHIIGVLRAIGYRRRRVLLGLLAEAGVTATIGVLVGVTAGLVLGLIYFHQFGKGQSFGVDGPTLWGSLALVYAAVFAVTFAPALRASRLPPAEAVRYTD